jgi:hypothetical protein
MEYTVIKGGKTVYSGSEKPAKQSDGSLKLPSGELLPEGSYRMSEHKNPRPKMPRASVPPKTGRERKDPTRGWSEDNRK